MNDELIGRTLGQYQITEIIGHGGMATVYKAYQDSLERFVAIKVLTSRYDPQFATRFRREARAIARLQHPNILTVHDHGEQDGLLYLVLPYIENGATLTDVHAGPMPPAQALHLMSRVLDGLGYAHARGVIHRDIKPSNILMPAPRWPMLSDFGIAKILDDSQPFTQSGFIIGTAAYMAPELTFGRTADARTDLYAIGIVLYELITGRVPFDADTPVAMLYQHAYAPLPKVRELNPAIPEEVETLITQALAKDPDQRFQNAGEMSAAAEQIADTISQASKSHQVTYLFRAGVRAFEQQDWPQAVVWLNRVRRLDPSHEGAAELLQLAQAELTTAAHPSTPDVPSQSPNTPASTESLPDLTEQVQVGASDADHQASAPDSASTIAAQTMAATRIGARWLWPVLSGAGLIVALMLALAVFREFSTPPKISSTLVPLTNAIKQSTTQVALVLVQLPTDTDAPAATQVPIPTTALIAAELPVPTEMASLTETPVPTEVPEPTTASPPDALTIVKTNLRQGPASSYPSLGVYNQGTALHVVGKVSGGDWLRVEAPDSLAGWMFRQNIQLNVALANVPVVDAPATPPRVPSPRPQPIKSVPTVQSEPTVQPVPPTEMPTPEPPMATLTPTKKPSHGCGGGCKPRQP